MFRENYDVAISATGSGHFGFVNVTRTKSSYSKVTYGLFSNLSWTASSQGVGTGFDRTADWTAGLEAFSERPLLAVRAPGPRYSSLNTSNSRLRTGNLMSLIYTCINQDLIAKLPG